jgi:hypothetical protein
VKGFGGVSADRALEADRSQRALDFYDYYLDRSGGDNLKRTALGFFELRKGGPKVRGVAALRDLRKGDDIINIPYELAINLGPESEDPTLPALQLLRDYCTAMNGEREESVLRYYFDMLPAYMSQDCLGSTDFFSDEALAALQSPLIVRETLQRREKTRRRFERDIALDDTFPTWIDGTPITVNHLQWAVWLVTSRVLTVQGAEGENRSYRLLIPYLDMCNHDRGSSHVLTGRAAAGGRLRVVAGGSVKAGEQVSIRYGGGVAGNDRFIQDYGFLDADAEAYDIVARELLGKRRIREGINAGRMLPQADRDEALEALRATSTTEDLRALEAETDPQVRSAIEYRLGVKRALSRFIVMA